MQGFHRRTRLSDWYSAMLRGGSRADFICSVTSAYSLASLSRLAEYGHFEQRCAAVAALGMVASDRDCKLIGRALSDSHRSVRLAADRWIPCVWRRIDPPRLRLRLTALPRLVHCRPRDVLAELDGWERTATRHAIVWQLRGNALETLGCPDEAIECYRIALQVDGFRYTAAWRQATLMKASGHLGAALQLFRTVVEIFPSHVGAREQVAKLQRVLD